MKIIINKDARQYLEKQNSTGIVINMLPDRTSSCCGTGKTKKFYTPFLRPIKPGEQFNNSYAMYQADGITVFIANRAVKEAKDTIEIFVEKSFLAKELGVKGIGLILEE